MAAGGQQPRALRPPCLSHTHRLHRVHRTCEVGTLFTRQRQHTGLPIYKDVLLASSSLHCTSAAHTYTGLVHALVAATSSAKACSYVSLPAAGAAARAHKTAYTSLRPPAPLTRHATAAPRAHVPPAVHGAVTCAWCRGACAPGGLAAGRAAGRGLGVPWAWSSPAGSHAPSWTAAAAAPGPVAQARARAKPVRGALCVAAAHSRQVTACSARTPWAPSGRLRGAQHCRA